MLPTSTLTVHPARLTLPVRMALLGGLFFLDKVFLNAFVDFDLAQAATGLGATVREVQHWGFRFLVAWGAALLIFAAVRGGAEVHRAAEPLRQAALRLGWLLAHGLLMACLVPLTLLLYRNDANAVPLAAVLSLWVPLALGAAASAMLTLAPMVMWLRMIRALGIIWSYSLLTAAAAASAIQLSQRLWAPTAFLTFDLVRLLLLPIIPNLSADTVTRVLSTDRFSVEVSDICSGLEGMGLVLAFSTAWLIYFRREYVFPRALILIPAGLFAIFSLNIIRIAVLMLIGHAGFPEIAEYGFHSQAGWIAFNCVACGLAVISRRSAWLNRAMPVECGSKNENWSAIYLMPFLGVLAAGTLSHALSGQFETLYPLRLAVGVFVLWRYRSQLATIDWRWSWRGPALGLCVFVVWMLGAHFLLTDAAMPPALAAMSPPLRAAWLASRMLASVVTVPIAEELAYRGFLMRRLGHENFESIRYDAVRWPAVVLTAALFGMAHGTLWIPGTLAGLAYAAIVVRRGSLGEAVAAHMTTNLWVGVAVVAAGQWQLW